MATALESFGQVKFGECKVKAKTFRVAAAGTGGTGPGKYDLFVGTRSLRILGCSAAEDTVTFESRLQGTVFRPKRFPFFTSSSTGFTFTLVPPQDSSGFHGRRDIDTVVSLECRMDPDLQSPGSDRGVHCTPLEEFPDFYATTVKQLSQGWTGHTGMQKDPTMADGDSILVSPEIGIVKRRELYSHIRDFFGDTVLTLREEVLTGVDSLETDSAEIVRRWEEIRSGTSVKPRRRQDQAANPHGRRAYDAAGRARSRNTPGF